MVKIAKILRRGKVWVRETETPSAEDRPVGPPFRGNSELIVDHLPMYINLGDIDNWNSHIGWAQVFHDVDTGRSKIEIDLDERSSATLGSMVELFDLKAIGFAGIKNPDAPLPEKTE